MGVRSRAPVGGNVSAEAPPLSPQSPRVLLDRLTFAGRRSLETATLSTRVSLGQVSDVASDM